MAINSILQFDLGGQCVSESIKYSPYTGLGGQADFNGGAWLSNGGKGFLCTQSTYVDKEGKRQSKIVPTVDSWVGCSRWDTQYLVTEYGCEFIRTCTMKERIQKIIGLAHPDFREWLVEEAAKKGFIHKASEISLKGMRTTV